MPTPALSDKTLKEAMAAYEKAGRVALYAAKALGINEATMRNRLRRARERFAAAKTKTAPAAAAPTKRGRGLEEFRSQHDKDYIVPRRLREALKALGASGWEYESQLARLAGVGLADLANYREMFEDHIVALRRDGKRAWAGSVALAAKMREMVR